MQTVRNLETIFAGVQQHAGHRRPGEAGGADAYYGRAREPNFTIHGVTIEEGEMTAAEVAEYHAGYTSERGRKDFGFNVKRSDDGYGDDETSSNEGE